MSILDYNGKDNNRNENTCSGKNSKNRFVTVLIMTTMAAMYLAGCGSTTQKPPDDTEISGETPENIATADNDAFGKTIKDTINDAKEMASVIDTQKLKKEAEQEKEQAQSIAEVAMQDTEATESDSEEGTSDEEQEEASENIEYDNSSDTGVYGGRGRLYYKNYSAALYDSAEQSVVNAIDSAAAFVEDGTLIIADHWNQGFDIIKSAKVGDVCEIRHSDGSCEQYECVDVNPNLHNNEIEIKYEDWETCAYGRSDLLTYTCNDNWKNVTGVFWNRI